MLKVALIFIIIMMIIFPSYFVALDDNLFRTWDFDEFFVILFHGDQIHFLSSLISANEKLLLQFNIFPFLPHLIAVCFEHLQSVVWYLFSIFKRAVATSSVLQLALFLELVGVVRFC